jgi:GT2 family glycosyltransferase
LPDTPLARHKSSLVAQGTGKYVALLDDDDLLRAEWLSRRVEFLEQHSDCVLVWAGHLDIDADGTELGRSSFPLSEGVHSSSEFLRAMMRANIVATPSVLVRRDAYARAGGAFDPKFAHINDYELWLRLGLLGPVGFIEIHDCGYRVHPEQMSRRHDRALDHLRLVDHLDGLLRTSYPELRLPERVRRRLKADRLLSAALDASENGQGRLAVRRIASAARLAPRALVSKRGLAAVAAVAGGKTATRRLGAMRS